ncbi:hypothetical protein ES708_14559 [subsurface metagenome]
MLSIPRGIEVLVKKASVDRDFRKLLLEKRDQAAEEIGLELNQLERNIIRSVPEEQLKTIISLVKVPAKHRKAFLGKVAAVMLAALGVMAFAGCKDYSPKPTRIQPDTPPTRVETVDEDRTNASGDGSDEEVKPDRPLTKGISPDRPPSRRKSKRE